MRKHLYCIAAAIAFFAGCQKPGMEFKQDPGASSYPSDVIDKWLTLEIRLFRDAKGISNGAFARPFAYSGISAFESTDPGKDSWKNKYNGLSSLPVTDKRKVYHWPSSVNASLAEFNRKFFTTVNSSDADIAAIDSLEKAIQGSFDFLPSAVADPSLGFGRAIADAVFAWSQTDNYNENNALPYTLPVGLGLWQLTPPAYAKPIGPFWGHDRPIIAGSGNNSQPPAPLAYSEDPQSAFYRMANDLYMTSKHLTTDQQNWAFFWRDVPGVTTPGHWMSILQQVIRQTSSRLDKATMAFALVGRDIAIDAGNSRFYGGIHYQPTIDISLTKGRIVGDNVIRSLGLGGGKEK